MSAWIAWTAEQDAMLTELVTSGATARQIGATMGKTKNAIIGRVTRMGLKLAHKPCRDPKQKPVTLKAKPVAPKPREPLKLTLPPVPNAPKVDPTKPVKPRMVSLLALDMFECKWPVDGVGEHTKFCAHPRRGGSSYCSHHHRLAYTPAEPRRRAAA